MILLKQNLKKCFLPEENVLINIADKVVISTLGNLGIGSTNPAGYRLYVVGKIYSATTMTPSDERLKRAIKNIDDVINKLSKLNGIKFEWKRDEYPDKGLPEGKHYGLIAQEVEKIFPEVIREDNEGYKVISYSEFIPILIEAIKEQQKEIEELKAKLETLQK